MSPDVRESASAWLTSVRRAHASATVTYVRGELEAEMPATVGQTVFDVPDEYGIFTRVESRDYLIEVADLEAFGEPQAGDVIQATLSDVVCLFEVMAPAGEPVFRYSDPYRKVFRIHTKYVGTEAA